MSAPDAATLSARLDRAFQDLAERPAGPDEGALLQVAYEALTAAVTGGVASLPHVARFLLMRLAAHDWLDRMEDWRVADRRLVERGIDWPLHMQLASVRPGLADRRELLAQRRLWGQRIEAKAALQPVARAARQGGEKIRLGFVSDDIRFTTIGAFAWPLFEQVDHSRFELFVYSAYRGPPDPIQQIITGWTKAYRHVPGASPRQLAELIAADGLDMLIETGPLAWEAVAYRPAPIQASWMGYPNPSGLAAIDYVIVDPSLLPEDPDMMVEKPLVMPRCWLTLAEAYFEAEPPLTDTTPVERNGYVTFGSMNSTYKFSAPCLDAWARVVAATPQSQFLIVRPEAAAPVFRENVLKAFAKQGVAPERIRFEAVRGQHLPWYREMDIALDSFPVTGGTTTCESLWMGVPVISLVGAALFERVSYSILVNAGLSDLTARTVDDYVTAATRLAMDPARLMTLKKTMRARLRSQPIGRTEAFVRDFYGVIAQAVAEGPKPPALS